MDMAPNITASNPQSSPRIKVPGPSAAASACMAGALPQHMSPVQAGPKAAAKDTALSAIEQGSVRCVA